MENTLVYKRTHKGDPNLSGIFGIHDCMGQDRGWAYEAVIGVGGKRPRPKHRDIACKINWVGIGPLRREHDDPVWDAARRPGWNKKFKGPLVQFKFFRLWDEEGPYLRELAPKLFSHMFIERQVRALTSDSLRREMQDEVQGILRWAKTHQSKKPRAVEQKLATKCKP
jgi:hypothetical protein